MRISDWSSDVCSSDLDPDAEGIQDLHRRHHGAVSGGAAGQGAAPEARARPGPDRHRLDRKSVVTGTSVSVRVDLGGRLNIKKQKHTVISHIQYEGYYPYI